MYCITKGYPDVIVSALWCENDNNGELQARGFAKPSPRETGISVTGRSKRLPMTTAHSFQSAENLGKAQ